MSEELKKVVTEIGLTLNDKEGALEASARLGKEVKVSVYAAVRRALGLKRRAGRPKKAVAQP